MEENEMSNEEQRPVPVQQDEPERQVFDTIWTELIALRDRLGQGKDIATGLQDLSSFVARFAFHDPLPVQQEPGPYCKFCRDETPCTACGRTQYAREAVEETVPVQQDEPEGVCAFPNCSCTENRCPGVGGEPCRGCGVPTGVGAYHHIGCRTPEPNPAPVQQDEPECDHVWRSSFGDTFCEKCNQDAPTGVRCRTCKGSGAWCDEGWVKPPQPCKACSGSGRVPAKRKAAPSVPEAAPLPRSRPPRSHRDDESLRRWEARHPSVGFPPAVPVQQEPERWAVRRAEIVERVGGEQAFADIVAEVARQHEEGEK